MGVYVPVSVASDGRPQGYQEVCSVLMEVSNVDNWGDGCDSTSHHGKCDCCGINAICAGW